jgi:5-methylcytosine-specific restriction endonuclease McrA
VRVSAQGWSRVDRKKRFSGATDANTIPVTMSECGTNSGYSAHYYYKDLPPCYPCKLARKNYIQEWKARNPGYAKKSWEKFKELNPNYKKDYHKNNPEQSRKDARTRRAKVRKVESSSYTEAEMLDLYGLSCHLCKEQIDLTASRKQGEGDWKMGLHLDHLIPISAGGSNTLDNVRPAHALCNLQKGNQWRNIKEKN